MTINVRREARSGGKNVIKRIMPRQNEQVNETWICDKGRMVYQYTESPQRLVMPLVRKNGELVETDWEDALKLAAEKLFVQSNSYAGSSDTRFSCVRYGNVVGSRGSVIPVFRQQRSSGTITITDERMTRFLLTLDEGVSFVIRCIEQMQGGEVFVPKIASATITDIAKAIAPDAKIEYIGIRPGEKLHEVLISDDEARSVVELEDMFVVQPTEALWFGYAWAASGKPLPDGYRYASNTNDRWLSVEEISKIA